MGSILFNVRPFNSLELNELYEIMRLRQLVFVVEQDCAYLDADGLDEAAVHIFHKSKDGNILVYARVLPPGHGYDKFAAIGRVVTDPGVRNQGFGREIMRASIKFLDETYPFHDIKIMAQTYLIDFYQSLGFKPEGEEFLEDGIPHVNMIYNRDAQRVL